MDFIDGLKVAWINRYTKGSNDHWCDIIDSGFNLNIETRRELLRMGDSKNINSKNKRVGIASVLLALERVARLFPTPQETGDNSWFGQTLLHNSNIKAIRPVGNTLEKRIITNEYIALPISLNLSLNEIYRSGNLLNEAELEARLLLGMQDLKK